MRVDIPAGLQLLFGPVSHAAVEEDGTSGLVIEVFDDSDEVDADAVLLRVCPQAACQTMSKAFLKSMKIW